MAKLVGPFQFTGKLQGYSAYTRSDVEGIIIRKSGGASASKIATDRAFVRTRENNNEFGGASTSAKLLRLAMSDLISLADSDFSGRSTSFCRSILRLGGVGTRGKRSIPFSNYRHLIGTLNPNLKKPFTAIVKQEVSGSIIRELCSGTVILPDLIPKVNFLPPPNMPRFQFIVTLGAITDMMPGDGFYTPSKDGVGMFAAAKVVTAWFPINKRFTGFPIDIISRDTNLDETCTLVLSVGIRFGKMGDDDVITPQNKGGAFKILTAV